MGAFNRKNYLGEPHGASPAPIVKQEQQVMATENLEVMAKVIGFAVIGIWLVSVVGLIVASVASRKSRAERLEKHLKKLEESIIPKTYSREKIVAQLNKGNAQINRLMVECINEGPLWTSVNTLVRRGWVFLREKLTILDAVKEVDKLYVQRDEKVFVNRAMSLAKEINGSAAFVRLELTDLTKELNKAGYQVSALNFFTESYDNLESLRRAAGQLGELYEAYIQFASEEMDASRLSVKGEFKFDAFVRNIEEDIKNYDKEEADTSKGVAEIEKIRLEKDEVKAFLKSSDEIRHADEILTANVKLLAFASKIRAACASSTLRVEEALLGAVNGAIKSEYQKKSEPSRPALESLDGSKPSNKGGIMIEQIYTENNQVFETLLNLGTILVRESGIQAEFAGEHASKFKDSDVTRLLAARIQNRKKF